MIYEISNRHTYTNLVATSPEKISKTIFHVLENPQNDICVSAISFLEIAIKSSVKKIDLDGIEISDLIEMRNEQSIQIIELPISSIIKYQQLPLKDNHKDPFDRALVSICLSENFTFLSVDKKVVQYKENGLTLLQ